MGSMNRVFLMGNLTRKPELRHTPTGVAVMDMGLAVSDSYRNKAGETVESTCFTDVVVWGRQAEACEQHLGKGAPVAVEGRLQYEQWQTEKGEKRSRLRVRADRVQFLGRVRGMEQNHDGEPGVGAAPSADGEQGDGNGEMPF